MKILVICQYYYPEPFRITDICEELARQGHTVTVVTGTPNYPMGDIYPGYEDGKNANEVLNGVSIHRCVTTPRKTGAVNRILNYFSYSIQSNKYIKELSDDYDVVFVNQLSPVMMAHAGITYKKKHRKKLVLYCLDLWPDSLCVGGIKKKSFVYKIFKKISKHIYRQADKILVTSQTAIMYFVEMFGIEKSAIAYLPQYAESQFLDIKIKEPTKVFNLLFAGNIGKAQCVDTIIEAAKILKDESVIFHIVGDGIELERLKKIAIDLPNVIFYGRRPLEEMVRYYAIADAMIVTLSDDWFANLTLPGKVQSYLAAGRPVIGAAGGETFTILSDCQKGYCGKAKDEKMLAKNILDLINSKMATNIGMTNREYYLQHFSKDTFINKLLLYLAD